MGRAPGLARQLPKTLWDAWPPQLLMSDPVVSRHHPHAVHRLYCLRLFLSCLMPTLNCSFPLHFKPFFPSNPSHPACLLSVHAFLNLCCWRKLVSQTFSYCCGHFLNPELQNAFGMLVPDNKSDIPIEFFHLTNGFSIAFLGLTYINSKLKILSVSPSSFWHMIQTSDKGHCACQLSLTVFSRQGVRSEGRAYIIGLHQNPRPSRRGVRSREL